MVALHMYSLKKCLLRVGERGSLLQPWAHLSLPVPLREL